MASMNQPYSERAVLSTCLNRLNSGIFSRIAINTGKNPDEIFAEYPNRLLYKSIGAIYENGQTPSIASVTDKLKSMSGDDIDDPSKFILDISLETPISNMQAFDSSIQELNKARLIREQIKELDKLMVDIRSGEAEVEPSDISARILPIAEMAEVEDDAEIFSEMVEDIINSERPAMWTVSTGNEQIDNVLGGNGLESGCLTVVAARPKVGKTVFMNSMVNNVLEHGAVPLIINLETKKVEFIAKMISSHMAMTELPWPLVKNRLAKDPTLKMTDEQERLFQEGLEWALQQDWRVTFNKSMNIPDIRAMIVNTKSELPADAKVVLFVDYIQLQVSDTSREREEISALTKFYKTISTELDISIVILAQINRDGAGSASGGRPYVHQIKSSGSIEQDADSVLLLDRPSLYNSDADKNKMIVYGTVTRLAGGEDFELFADGATNSISEWTEEHSEQENNKKVENSVYGDDLL